MNRFLKKKVEKTLLKVLGLGISGLGFSQTVPASLVATDVLHDDASLLRHVDDHSLVRINSQAQTKRTHRKDAETKRGTDTRAKGGHTIRTLSSQQQQRQQQQQQLPKTWCREERIHRTR